MTHETETYRGREQSYVKHLFLTRYLKEAAFKIFQGRSRAFNFVDAFAGPWNVADESDYSDTSFDPALRTLDEVRSHLRSIGRGDFHIRFCLCEKRRDAARKLRQYAKAKSNFEIHVFHGMFENHLTEITAACADGFTFTFIDPTGWDIDSSPILDFLRDRNGEFMLNFMAEHVNRHAGYDSVQASFGRFLASNEWRQNYDQLPDEWNNEQKILYLLRRKIKSTQAATYVPHFQILKPGQERVKMRLLLGTHSREGLRLFREIHGKVEREETKLHEKMNENSLGIHLFPIEELAKFKQGNSGIGSASFEEEAKVRTLSYLSKRGEATFQFLATSILDEIPMRMTQVNKLFSKMRRSGAVEFELPSNRQVPKPDTVIRLPKL